MHIRNFVLSFYPNTADGVHIQRVERPREAREYHTHEYYQIYYIAKGSLTHHLSDTAVRLSRGDMFLIPPGVTHKIQDDDGILFYSLSFTPQVLDEVSRSAGFAADFLRNFHSVRPKVSVPADEILRIESMMEQIHREFEAGQVAASEIIKLYIGLLLSLFARICLKDTESLPLPGQDDKTRFLLYCVDYIEHNYFQNLTLDSIVKQAAVSKSEFCKGFRAITGHSFHQYLNLCRVRDAVRRIENGEKISAVCQICGYRDFSTFYRNFFKIMGMSPTEYRNLNLNPVPQ